MKPSQFECPACHAGPGTPCAEYAGHGFPVPGRILAGQTVSYYHAARIDVAMEASTSTDDDNAIAVIREFVTGRLNQCATDLRSLARLMRENETHFSEDAFDELPRIADKLDEFREGIE